MKTNAMNQIKCFRDMTAKEQTAWMTSFNDFRETKWPVILSHSHPYGDNVKQMLKTGVCLFAAFPQYRSFVDDTLRFQDYHRRIRKISQILESIRTNLTVDSLSVKNNGKNRPGRPTREEVQERERQARLAVDKEEQQKQIDRMNGVVPSKPIANVDINTIPSLFDQMNNDGQHPDERMFTVREISWLLSSALREECEKLSELLSIASAEANQAKDLAKRNVAAELIAPHTQAAEEANNAYQTILRQVDAELRVIYDGETAHPSQKFKETLTERGYLYDSFMSRLSQHAKKSREESAAKELSSRKRAIRDYFSRKDIRLTPERIKVMKERLEEARVLGMDVEKFESLTIEAEGKLMAQSEATQATVTTTTE